MRRGFTLIELIAMVVIIGIAAMLLLPATTRCGEPARRTACASNLGQIGKALMMYADVPSNGMYPTCSPNPKDPYDEKGDAQRALNLLYRGYVNDARVFSCPQHPMSKEQLAKITPTVGGVLSPNLTYLSEGAFTGTSYAYDPGHVADDSMVIVAADRKGDGLNSDNHGKNAGQNVLAAGGNVEFRTTVENPMGTDDETKQPLKDSNIYSRNPELPRHLDSYLRQ